MRLCWMVISLVLGGATVAAAQEVAVGVKGGVNFANVQYEGEDANVTLDHGIGFVGGLFVIWPADTGLALQLEALYSQKGATFDQGGFKGNVEMDFFDVPILLHVSSARNGLASFHAFGGPSVGFRLGTRSALSIEVDSFRVNISDKIKRMDVGLVAGAGVDVGRFTIDGRYTWGLTELNDDPGEEVTIKNRVFSVMAGVRF